MGPRGPHVGYWAPEKKELSARGLGTLIRFAVHSLYYKLDDLLCRNFCSFLAATGIILYFVFELRKEVQDILSSHIFFLTLPSRFQRRTGWCQIISLLF